MKIGAVILCRLDSSRLPGKAFLEVGGMTLLEHVLAFCRKIDGIDTIALATSDRAVDDPLSNFSKMNDITCIRGSLENVAERFLYAMETLNLDAAIRINGDSPLINARLISDCVQRFKVKNFDLVSNVPGRTYPYGMSVEVVGRDAMMRAVAIINDPEHKEHVTKYFYDNPDEFHISIVTSGKPHFSEIQLAIDTYEDFNRFVWIINQIEGDPTDADIETLVRLAKSYKHV
jgi:spore coat polysaccharide biosynthesis protein SpsF (cytidylyltransferase family)